MNSGRGGKLGAKPGIMEDRAILSWKNMDKKGGIPVPHGQKWENKGG